MNPKHPVNISIKTSGSNTVDMADCLRLYDIVSSTESYHLICIFYSQCDATHTKHCNSIYLVNLSGMKRELFGDITREELVELRRRVTLVPHKRSPTPEERQFMYEYRDALHRKRGAVRLAIKCNST